ncbi:MULTISPECIES: flagellar hook-associated protein FlgK [unclassified Geobacillus]|uniref:flagellar hook-associated protein FlgK n=1 Tax=unclassified Geobacillus TaxID=2642459 RepID=UPI000BE324CD|nr:MULTISPECIES: flagellar hook-associated protein FlgK [unclassified Geobacillus]PDM39210.1 flagellar hook-associated protein FlgK [Parageobacillus yumthangensis]RDV22585.1 flagellar hook-associated protein FlgK [Parageobacillus toebii]TXK91090.1 flagellar hook-associated protein FlgK [Parageobacillus sp. SY1]PUF87774.1 flagellar hook-associated protein FlgK [Geobacillus sp. LYN3]TXK87634.1 flagellar hook-associated protein FlgK [Geobacillus sp. AYS3]
MLSTFHGLEAAKRGMMTQQAALYVTGHNVANANTPGFTRQRVNFVQTEPFPSPGLNRPQIPGQMGTGVKAGSVERVREYFLDIQYRGENNKLGYWEARADAIAKMEDIMNEPSDNGLAKTMDQFWQALQDLSVNPENEGARSVVRQRGLAVVETFHYLSNSLSQIQTDIGTQIGVTITQINSLAKQISEINQQIASVEPNGYLPNDLYDERDRLIDELSKLINVQVEKHPTGGNAPATAEGTYDIYFLNGNEKVYLVQGGDFQSISFPDGQDVDGDKEHIKEMPPATGVTELQVGGTSVSFTSNNQVTFPMGKLRGLIEAYGYVNGQDSNGQPIVTGIYPDMLNNLDKLAYTFGKLFNAVHEKGYGLNGETGVSFFDGLGQEAKGAAKTIRLSADIDDLANIAASTEEGKPGNGNNAINLANVGSMLLSAGTVSLIGTTNTIQISTLNLPLTSGTIQTNYQGWIGKIGVDGQQANRMKNNSDVLRQSVEERRQSVSSVSLDEEMMNMIKFQHAYNAAARQITVVDEMLDKIINGMGIVGR